MTELEKVLTSLKLQQISGSRFKGHNPDLAWRRTYGGLLLAHAVRAAQLSTHAAKELHSIHGSFLRPGSTDQPFQIATEPLLDGQTIANRQLRTTQDDRLIFTAFASLRSPGSGLRYGPPMPEVPSAANSIGESKFLDTYGEHLSDNAKRYLSRKKAFELRFVDPAHFAAPKQHRTASNRIWLRLAHDCPVDVSTSVALLVYASDMTILDAALTPHELNFFARDLSMASLDHAFWLHQPPDWSDWILFDHHAAGNSAGMGLGKSNVFSSTGELLATVMQQGLIRLAEK